MCRSSHLLKVSMFCWTILALTEQACSATVLTAGQTHILNSAVAVSLSQVETGRKPKIYVGSDGIPVYEIDVVPGNSEFPQTDVTSISPSATDKLSTSKESTESSLPEMTDSRSPDQPSKANDQTSKDGTNNNQASSPDQPVKDGETSSGSGAAGSPNIPANNSQNKANEDNQSTNNSGSNSNEGSGKTGQNQNNQAEGQGQGSNPASGGSATANDPSGKSTSSGSTGKGETGNEQAGEGRSDQGTKPPAEETNHNDNESTENSKPKDNEAPSDQQASQTDDGNASPTNENTVIESPEMTISPIELEESPEPSPAETIPFESPDVENSTSSNAVGTLPEATPEDSIDDSSSKSKLIWAVTGSLIGLLLIAGLIGFLAYRMRDDEDGDEGDGESGPLDDADVGIALDVARPRLSQSRYHAEDLRDISEDRAGTTGGIHVPTLRLENTGM